MSEALERAERVIALCSAAYFERDRYTTMELTACLTLARDRLIPVHVERLASEQLPSVLRPLIHCDISRADEATAKRLLLAAVTGRLPPGSTPPFPGTAPTIGGQTAAMWSGGSPQSSLASSGSSSLN
jgi:hypothetical protein